MTDYRCPCGLTARGPLNAIIRTATEHDRTCEENR